MSERVGITEADLRRLLDLVDPARCDGPGEEVPDSLLHDLRELVACDAVTFQVMDPYRRTIAVHEVCPDNGQPAADQDVDHAGDQDAELESLWWPAMWEHCSYPQRSGDYESVLRGSDELPGVRSGPAWKAYVDAAGLPVDVRGGSAVHHVMVVLPPVGVVDRRLLLWRDDGRDFSDRDVLLLTLLRPHLVALNQRQRMRANGPAELTTRQWEILRLVAVGCSNIQIARALTLSEATVRKHLENIYARLDVNSRTEALAKTRLTAIA